MGVIGKIEDEVKETVWKWRCKIAPQKDYLLEKPLDLESVDDDDDGVKAPIKDPTFGADAIVKTMYEGRDSVRDHYEWVDYPPKQLSKSAARAQDRVAIKIYKVKDREKPSMGGRFPLKYHMIEVQNPVLVAALAPILKKEALLLDTNETATFKEPFRPLWFCQDDIVSLYKTTEAGKPLKQYLELFIRVLDDMFSELRSKRRHQLASGLVDHKSAWILFPRGSTLYTYGVNSESVCKVESTTIVSNNHQDDLLITVKVLAFDGREYIWKEKPLTIPYFEGKKLITELPHYPFDFHSRKDETLKRLTARGKKALDFQGLSYCTYDGIALHVGQQCVERHNVESRILVDVVGYNRYHLAKGKRENDNPNVQRVDRIDRADYTSESEEETRRSKPRKTKAPKAESKTNGKRLTAKEEAENKQHMLAKEEDLCFMSELVGGYALNNKQWVQFYIEDIEPMVWNEEAYSHLVYDEQQKDLILSFVENHGSGHKNDSSPSDSAPMDDVILGKGQGLIILLSGPPGTGKTLTAEAVADRTKRPLFYLQAEDLGINPAALGANVKRVFEMATDWNAVILLDEADVFMAERNPNDVQRNELVSIFLRELEYFRGIIFLTTNLYSTIDSAFRSRVSLHLLFQPLAREARESVWRKFLQRLPEQKHLIEAAPEKATGGGKEAPSSEKRPLDDEDLRELSLWQLNGREIKNAIKMVRSWCSHKGYSMTLERLESGIRVTTPHASKEGEVDNDLYE